MEGTPAPTWPALQAMNGEGGMMTVGMSMQMGGPKEAQKAAAAPAFTQLLDSFEKEAIPGTFASPARDEAKKTFVESLRGIAKGGSDDEIKALWQKALDSKAAIMKP